MADRPTGDRDSMELADLLTLFHSLRECTDLDALRAAKLEFLPTTNPPSSSHAPELQALSLALIEARHRTLQDERAASLETVVRERLLARTHLSLTLVAVLDSLLPLVNGEAGALVMEDGGGQRRNRLLAAVGLHHWLSLDRELGVSPAEYGRTRMIVPFRVGVDRYAALELLASPLGPFQPADAALCARAVCLLQPWLTGILEGGSVHARVGERLLDVDAFEARALSEFDRATRFRSGVGLVVVDTHGGLRDQHALVLGPLVEHVRRHLRAKDAVGRLADGRLGVLVVETDQRGLASVSQRIAQPLEGTLLVDGPVTPLVGSGWFPTSARCFDDLVSTALDDMGRRATPLLHAADTSDPVGH